MGRWLMEKRTAKDLLRAIEYFQHAIDKSPEYALAYAGMADTYILLPQYSTISFKEAYKKSKNAALMALRYDKNLGEAYISLAMGKTDHDWNWEGGLKDFERALELAPGNAAVLHWYGFTLMQMARFDESEKKLKKALELDPVSPIINRNLGVLYYYSGQYDLAITQLQKGIELDENLAYTHLFIGLVLCQQSKYEEALAECQKESKASRSYYLGTDSTIGICYAKLGNESRAREILEDLIRRVKHESIGNQYTFVANLCFFLGETDRGFEFLDKAFQVREIWITFIKIYPYYDSIRNDPRFIALLEKIGLND